MLRPAYVLQLQAACTALAWFAAAVVNALEADEAAIPAYPVQNALTGALRKLAAAQGDAQYLSLWAGQGVAQARALPAAALLQQLGAEWRKAGAQ